MMEDRDCIQSETKVIGTVNIKESSKWEAIIQTNNTLVKYKLDIGAEINVLPKSVYKGMQDKPKLIPTAVTLTAYNDTNIPIIGKCIANIQIKDKVTPVLFMVADGESTPILGQTACEKLQLIKQIYNLKLKQIREGSPEKSMRKQKKNKAKSKVTDGAEHKKAVVTDHEMKKHYLRKFPNVFGEMGTLPGEYHMVTNRNVSPVIPANRKFLFASLPKIKEELDRMVKLGVITLVNGPSEWVSSMVVAEKPNNKIRVCLDPKDLNKAVLREHFKIPTPEEIFTKMQGAKCFAKLDASSGYWQIKVDEETSNLLTFNTPFGRYRYLRLQFGIHSASEVFRKKVSHIIEGLGFAFNYQDDIIIWAYTLEELDERVKEVLRRIEKSVRNDIFGTSHYSRWNKS